MTIPAPLLPLLRFVRAATVAVLAASTACAAGHADLTQANLRDQELFHVIEVGQGGYYVIDARTESCLLVIGNVKMAVAAPVSCALLKKNLPEAARFITWDTPADRRS